MEKNRFIVSVREELQPYVDEFGVPGAANRKCTVRAVAKIITILLTNLFQSSRSTFSWGSFSSFFAFKEGMWDTQIAALWNSPTVSLPFLIALASDYQ
jgi:hypothetical protein